MPPNTPFSSNVGTFIEQTTKVRTTSPVAWWKLVGATSTQIVDGGGSRVGLLFHNPGSVNLFFCPAYDGTGSALAAGSNGGAGSLVVAPGQFVYVGQDSPIGVAFNVAAASGTNNPATVWEFI